jgi:hypothetical protein
LVVATTRTSTCWLMLLPTRSNVLSWSTRSSLACSAGAISLISSSSSVPPSANSNRPRRRRSAPVKAPFSWPNNSLSSRFSDNAAQLTASMGRSRRSLAWWMARATTSLPVPLSPRIRTVELLRPTRSIFSRTSCITGLLPISGRGTLISLMQRSAWFSRTSRPCSKARSTNNLIASPSNGFWM